MVRAALTCSSGASSQQALKEAGSSLSLMHFPGLYRQYSDPMQTCYNLILVEEALLVCKVNMTWRVMLPYRVWDPC